jgi:ribosomal protein S18 acetylase RimI-like enzyme
MMCKVDRLSEEHASRLLPELVALLQDSINGGASLGFIPPLASETAEQYWRETLKEIGQGTRILLVASEAGGEVTGSVQLALATKQNAQHRAEVQKLFVHTRARGRGIGRRLMSAIDEAAREAGRTLLVLDTEQDSAAENLYASCGYTRAGIIPQYALSADGSLINTVVFYRLL